MCRGLTKALKNIIYKDSRTAKRMEQARNNAYIHGKDRRGSGLVTFFSACTILIIV